jgi:hypothetical protein
METISIIITADLVSSRKQGTRTRGRNVRYRLCLNLLLLVGWIALLFGTEQSFKAKRVTVVYFVFKVNLFIYLLLIEPDQSEIYVD